MTGIRQRVSVDFMDREPLGLVFREDLKGGFIEVIRVKSGGAAERMGVSVGWKVAAVDEKRMDHVKFDAVMRHLHNQRRPLRVCFERGAEPERVNTHFEVAVRSPTGAVLPVLVPTQNGRGSTTGQLKQLLVTQHARLLPADALRLVENTPVGSDSSRSPWGVRQQSAWGETAQTELPNHTRLTELTRRLQVGNPPPPRELLADSVDSGTDPASCAQRGSFLSLTVDQPHRASAHPRHQTMKPTRGRELQQRNGLTRVRTACRMDGQPLGHQRARRSPTDVDQGPDRREARGAGAQLRSDGRLAPSTEGRAPTHPIRVPGLAARDAADDADAGPSKAPRLAVGRANGLGVAGKRGDWRGACAPIDRIVGKAPPHAAFCGRPSSAVAHPRG